MTRFEQTVRRQVRRARDVERFVRQIVAGGLALVAGLWIATLVSPGSLPWLFGAGLAVLGVVELGAGIRSEIEY